MSNHKVKISKLKFSEFELTKINTIHHKGCGGGRQEPTLLPSHDIPWDKPIHTLVYKFQKSHLILKQFSLKIWKQEDINLSLIGVSTTIIDGDLLTVRDGGSKTGLMRTLRPVPSHHVNHRHRITLLTRKEFVLNRLLSVTLCCISNISRLSHWYETVHRVGDFRHSGIDEDSSLLGQDIMCNSICS